VSVEEFDRQIESDEKEESKKVFLVQIINETVKEAKRFFVTSFNQLANTIKKNNFKVTVTNPTKKVEVDFPKVQKVEITNQVSNKELADILRELLVKLSAFDIKVPDEVTVKNFPAPQRFPEIPKEMIVSNMGEIVKELQTVRAVIDKMPDRMPKEVKLKRGFFDAAPKVSVSVDNKELIRRIETLTSEVKAISNINIEQPEPLDLSPLIEAVNATTKSLDELEFPVPVFNAEGIINAVDRLSGVGPSGLPFALFGSLEDANYDYIAEQASDGRWRIMRIDKTTELVTYAFGEAPVPAQTDWATQTYGAWR